MLTDDGGVYTHTSEKRAKRRSEERGKKIENKREICSHTYIDIHMLQHIHNKLTCHEHTQQEMSKFIWNFVNNIFYDVLHNENEGLRFINIYRIPFSFSL